ncbi:MAG TPA: VWA domain-containing protein, partial [Vicinamibacterales bacterium]|nr:VWA domain-containing protein [Vicinamibacterales bacterium]
MTVSFLYPWFLLLAPAIALLWFLPRRSRGRDRTQRILRTCVFLLVVLALARPVLLTSDSETYQVFVVDESQSVSPARRVRQREAVAQLRGEFPASTSSLVVVGAGFEDRTGFSAVTEIRDSHSGSPLGAAIGAAARQVPEGARGVIHLFTDGLATD